MPPKQTKRATGTVGEGAAGKKAKATQHVGGQSVSEKSQVTRGSKNVFEKSNSKTQYFVREVKGRRMTWRGGTTILDALNRAVARGDPLMWWKQHVQEFRHLTRMARQHLSVPATSSSHERLFSSVGLVKSDLWGSLLDTTLIDVMWAKQAP